MKLAKLSLVTALALGGLIAFSTVATAQDAGKEKKGKHGMMSVEQRMEKLTTDLKLTDAQKPKVKAVLEDQHKKMQDMHKEGTPDREKMREMRTDMEKKMKEILTPDQFEKWQTLMREEHGKRGDKKGGDKKGEEKKQ